tara:strand:- start:269 stop:655 length:387 start_codon:yes stop_codon:yes gene_type:complete
MNSNNFNQQGIGQFLSPLISAINQDYSQDVVQPYVQQVENLTSSTFPDFDMGGGMGGGMRDFGGGQVQLPGQVGPVRQIGQPLQIKFCYLMKKMLDDMRAGGHLGTSSQLGSNIASPVNGIFSQLAGG